MTRPIGERTHFTTDPAAPDPACGTHATSVVSDPDSPAINCEACAAIITNRIRPVGEPHRLSLPMIDRPPRRILETECLGCGKSDTACDALYGTASQSCCHICKHDTQ